MIVVSDTSPISNLLQIGQLTLLKSLFEEVIIPSSVDNEVSNLISFGIDLTEYKSAQWIKIVKPKNLEAVSQLELTLDKGESEAIVVAKEIGADILLMDERLGTNIARLKGLETIGILGILIESKSSGLIPSVKPLVIALEEVGFYISKSLMKKILAQANEF